MFRGIWESNVEIQKATRNEVLPKNSDRDLRWILAALRGRHGKAPKVQCRVESEDRGRSAQGTANSSGDRVELQRPSDSSHKLEKATVRFFDGSVFDGTTAIGSVRRAIEDGTVCGDR